MSSRRRGSILFGVLLVVVLATLVATTAVYRVRNNTDIVRASIREDSSRALLRSGLRVYLSEFAESRVDLLRGGISLDAATARISPLLISDGLVISEIGGRRGIVRLLAQPTGALYSSESVRLDINRAPRESLLALPGMTDRIADAIIARRTSRPFESVEELLALEELDLGTLYGDTEVYAERYRSADEMLADQTAQANAVLSEPVLADLLTVFSAEPSVRSAIEGAADACGDPRLIFPTEVVLKDGENLIISEKARDILHPEEARLLDGATNQKSFLTRVINGLAPERRAMVLDAMTTEPDPFLLGRVDLTNASAQIIEALPGMDEEIAADLIERRSALTETQLASVTWPIDEGVLSTEQFLEIAPFISTRSLQFRVIIEAGFEKPSEGPRSGDFATLELEHRIVAEAVIDIAGETPHLAYIRDVTWLPDALKIHKASVNEKAADPEEWYDFPDPFAPLDLSGEDPEDDGTTFERPSDRADRQRRELRNSRPRSEDTQTERAVPETQPAQPPQGQDRRIGRWNGSPRSGSGGGS
ncbi:MAG: helix-hairpin-helix domain-containing protein [Phycisphaerales bacterium JB065]